MLYNKLVQALIDKHQDDFPLVHSPFSLIASTHNTSEREVMKTLEKMFNDDLISRIGPVYQTHKVGYSLLAACSCPESKIQEVALKINSFKEVNHNYERENNLNLWFVVTAKDEDAVYEVCKQIEEVTDLKVLCFPMLKPFKIDLSVKEKINWDLL